MVIAYDTVKQKIMDLLASVCDPEIPVLSIIDLGIVQNVFVTDTCVEISITPTYSGCPAMDAISVDIRLKLAEHGIRNAVVKQVLSPAWTTDWMTEEGKRKLQEYGIAPPSTSPPVCPQCGSTRTKLLSQFGSTSCKALYQCGDCKEPFDLFKCH